MRKDASTFASVLNSYCKAVRCTNLQISKMSGVSPSNLSRYRRDERKPEPGSPVIRQLAEAIAALSAETDLDNALNADDVHAHLVRACADPPIAGMDFNMRLDALMHLLGARNIDFAEVAGIDPSYISRIRHGQRIPADIGAFASICSHLAADMCINRNLLDEMGALINMPDIAMQFPPGFPNRSSEIAEAIEIWLTGGQMFTPDIAKLDELFQWLDTTDFTPWLHFADNVADALPESPVPVSRFYHGMRGALSAELKFLETTAKFRARNLVLSSDTPTLQLEINPSFKAKYVQSIESTLLNGSHIDVLYNIERPLEDTIKSLKLWIPYYITGHVTPYYLRGVNNRLFSHVNYVSDACALSSEAVIDHQDDGRSYFSTRPQDVAYYQKKMEFVLEKAVPLIEIYRECDAERIEMFRKEEAARRAKGDGRVVRAGKYKNIRVISYPGNCGVMTLPCDGQFVYLVSKHPKINYMASRM